MRVQCDASIQNGGRLRYGSTVLYKNLTVRTANEYFYEFLGENSRLYFNELIHPDYSQEFMEMCEQLDFHETSRVITMLMDRNGMYHVVDIYVHKEYDDFIKEELFCLDIYELNNVEKEYVQAVQKINKYRVILGLNDCIYIEYWESTRRIVIYKYVLQKAHDLYEGDIDTLLEDALKYADRNEDNIAEINKMYEKLTTMNNQFEVTIQTGFLNEARKMETYDIKFRYSGKDKEKIMVGVANLVNDEETDIPYYMTTAGSDPATGLLNKKSIIEYTETVLRNSDEKHYMILIDIDDFKNINDNFGHLAGDKAILHVAKVFADTLGARGIVGRFGGDEFFVFTEGINTEDELKMFLKTVVKILQSTVVDNTPELKVTLSMGIALYPDNGKSYNALFAIADKALYIAKEKGKARYIIYRPHLHDSFNICGRDGSSGITKNSEKSKVIKAALKSVMAEGAGAFEEAMTNICHAFDLDSVNVFCGSQLKLSYSAGKYPSKLEDASFIQLPGYAAAFDENGMMVINSIDLVKRVSTEVFELFNSINCVSMIHMALPSAKAPECVITFEVLNRKHKWNETEISNLDLFGTLIYEHLKK